MRYLYSGTFRDGAGNIVSSGTAAVYLAGTTTAASVYTTAVIVTSVNSVTSGSDGVFSFYVDDGDYASSQQFKIVLSKTGFTSKTYDLITIYPYSPFYIGTLTRVMDAASGAVAYTGVGFLPSRVIFIGTTATSLSFGIDDGTTAYNGYGFGASAAYNGANNSITLLEDGSKTQVAKIASLDSDGFTLTWTKAGSPSSSEVNVYYMAFR